LKSSIAFSCALASALAAQTPTLEPGVSAILLRPGRAAVRLGDPAANYRLASLTKHITAAAVLTLAKPDEKLTAFWPEFPDSITVEHLLRHQSGLVDYEDHLPPGGAQVKDRDVLDILRRHPRPKFPPGTNFEYSNSGYVLLAQIVEKRSGKPFRAYLHETFFRPLKMNCVAHEEGFTQVAHRAYGRPKDQSRTSATLGDGGVYCSLNGLEKWLNSRYPLDAAMLQPGRENYAFGWYVTPDRIWHTGTTVGFRNAILIDRRTNTKVAVLANRSDIDALKIAERLLHSAGAQ
jgi:CubicO group peptidase (beta-lactamase class C family)